LKEFPEELESIFDRILSEQMPKIARSLIKQKLPILPGPLGECLWFFIKYAPDLVSDVVVTVASVSLEPEAVLNVLCGHADLYQLVLFELILKGCKLNADRLNCSSSVADFMDSFLPEIQEKN